MKTLTDLFMLIAKITELNNGKQVKYLFDINTKFNWLSMYIFYLEGKVDTVINNQLFDTPEKLQQIYWTVYNNSRVE